MIRVVVSCSLIELMYKIFITYADLRFRESARLICNEAKQLHLFDKIISYSPSDLPQSVLSSPLMQYERGGGYWCWKPYIIWKTMVSYPDAIVVYADAGCRLQPNMEEWNNLFNHMNRSDVLLTAYRTDFDYGWQNYFHTDSVQIKTWTKKNTILFFDRLYNGTEWHDYRKILGGCVIAKNHSSLIRLWLDLTFRHPELIIDPAEQELQDQYPFFVAHRHDQSVLTPLAYYCREKQLCSVTIIDETAESDKSSAICAVRRKIAKKTKSTLFAKIRRKLRIFC